eukprot:CAMPEP_0117526144 /NCGR_PEP_ID=MMETSP0784-20121206/36135_1 /TAXON_ID=39447 /ORGANISM="" /LENGTH=122 /DNA_ID=CAMNT_0005322365 /DNA_START=194 /DNA_END=560 /DNA_ORIENTATION=+
MHDVLHEMVDLDVEIVDEAMQPLEHVVCVRPGEDECTQTAVAVEVSKAFAHLAPFNFHDARTSAEAPLRSTRFSSTDNLPMVRVAKRVMLFHPLGLLSSTGRRLPLASPFGATACTAAMGAW